MAGFIPFIFFTVIINLAVSLASQYFFCRFLDKEIDKIRGV